MQHPENPEQIVSITFFKLKGLKMAWGLSQMQQAQKPLSLVEGLLFHRMLGSGGGNGFSIRPDFSTYGLLGVWQDLATAQKFFQTSKLFSRFKTYSEEYWTTYMHTSQSRGAWSGKNPFPITGTYVPDTPIGIITRATIRPRLLLRFWKDVPQVSRVLNNLDGLLFSKGIGEFPLLLQATFSIWENRAKMVEYAYKSKFHREAIQKTKKLGWYQEELFAEFVPFATEGTWHDRGQNPLSTYFP